MTSNPSPLDRIRQLMDEDPITVDGTEQDIGMPTSDDTELESALSSLDHLALSREAQELLVGLTNDSAGLEPAARQKFVAAAQRALRKRRNDASPLPRVLFLLRQERAEDPADVAIQVGVDPEVLANAERGRVAIRELPVDAVVAWIQHFDVARPTARDALLEVLRVQSRGELAAAGEGITRDLERDSFFVEVMRQLDDTGKR